MSDPNSLYSCQLLQAQVPHPHVSVRLPEGGIGCESAAIAVGETLSFSHIFSVSVSAQHHIICCTSWLSHVRRMINVFDNCGRLCKVSPPAVNGYVSPPLWENLRVESTMFAHCFIQYVTRVSNLHWGQLDRRGFRQHRSHTLCPNLHW